METAIATIKKSTTRILFKCTITMLLVIDFNGLFAQDFWQPTNGPQGGIYRDISSNLVSGNIYLVTHWHLIKGNGLGSNIYLSSNNGMSWSEIDNGLDGQPVYGLAHSTTGNLVVSVMNAGVPLTPSIPTKIYFSSDNGGTWSLMNSNYFAGNLPPTKILFNAPSDTIYAGQKTYGISYSINNGATWQTMNTGITNFNITDIEEGYQGKMYACTDSIAGNGGKVFVKNSTTWMDVSTGLPNTRINDLHYDLSTSTMYLGTANFSTGTGDVYKSVNGGAWTQVPGFSGGEVTQIQTTPNGSPIVRLRNQGVLLFSDGNWLPANTNLNSLKTSGITRDITGNVLVTNASGIWKLNSLINTWDYFTNGMVNSQGRSMAFSQQNDLIVGTDNGMYKSLDFGSTWTHTGLTDETMMSTILYAPDGRMFAGNSNNAASHSFTSLDNGSSWSLNETGFSSTRTCDYAYNSQGKLFVGTGWAKPVHSSANGVAWNGPLWSTLGFTSNTVTIAIAIDTSDNIFVGTESQGVLRSTDDGTSYEWLNLTGGDVTDIQISPNQDVYVAHDAFSGNGNGGLYRSADSGNTWSSNLMPSHGLTNCIFIADDTTIYVGTSLGVWISTDTGNTWNLLNAGLNAGNLIIHTLELGPDGHLYAGTAGAGIYRSINSINGTITTVAHETTTNTSAFYPNPFSSSSTLKINQTLNNATLTISNSMGQLVKEINYISGQTVNILRENLSSGLYFVRLTENNKIILANKLLITD